MKLYLLKNTKWDNDYDFFDQCIVCAENEEDAKTIEPIVPDFPNLPIFRSYDETPNPNTGSWWALKKSDISCEEIGEANKDQKRGVILASFNAG